MVAFQSDVIIKNLYTSGQTLGPFLNNLVTYMTNGSCRDYRKCYHYGDMYFQFVGRENKVLGFSTTSKLNFEDLKSKIEKNSWHFLVGKFKPQDIIKPNIKNLLKLYGICSSFSINETVFNKEENYCKDIPKDKESFCGE